MSHFGKKTLNFWDWDMLLKNNNFFKTWNQTPKETQLLLLKKWYPIGMIGKRLLVGLNSPSGLKFEITGYIEYSWGYKLDGISSLLSNSDSNSNIIDSLGECHPLRFLPEKEDRIKILRELRLNKLLN